MNKNYKLIGGNAILSLCAAAGLFIGSSQAQEAYVQSRPCVECQATPRSLGGRVCIPNTQNWGYYTPTWRVWPNERRPDVTFPQSIGAERVPTPAGVRPENVPGPQNPRQSLIDPNANDTGTVRVNIPSPKDESLPKINFDSGSKPFEPTEMLPPTEPIPEITPAPTTEPAPMPQDIPLTTPQEPSAPAAQPAEQAPTDSVIPEPIMMPNSNQEEKPAEPPAPAPTIPKMDDVIPNFDPIIDPSLGATPDDSMKSVDIPSTPQPEEVQKDLFSFPPMTQSEPAPIDQPVAPMEITPSIPATDNGNASVNPLRNDDVSKKELKKSFRPRNTPSHVQSAKAPNDADTAMRNPMRSGEVKPIDSSFSPENPLRQSSAIVPAHEDASGPSLADIPQPIGNGMEPIAMEGYSLVDLINSEKWTPGKPEFAVVFEGRTYYCSDEGQREEFMSNPDKFTPACRGFDPMLKLQQNRNVDGKVDYCLVYGKKLYAFSSPDTMKQFREHAKQYSRQIAELEN